MADYWLDSNIFIEGKKGPYGFDIAPRFWALIAELTVDGRISCPVWVYEELLEGRDDLVGWAQNRKASGLFVEPSLDVQQAFKEITAYVSTSYPDTQATRRFLSRADPWVIAHAVAEGGAVVTMEIPLPPNVPKVTVPNVCNHLDFNVRYLNTYQLLRELGESWGP